MSLKNILYNLRIYKYNFGYNDSELWVCYLCSYETNILLCSIVFKLFDNARHILVDNSKNSVMSTITVQKAQR